MKKLLVASLVLFAVGCGKKEATRPNPTEQVVTPGGDEVEAIKKAVLVPQEAGWKRHDFRTYMTQWADKAQYVFGREEQPDKYDIVCDRKQIEATRRLLMHGKPLADRKIVFDNIRVKVQGDEAELRLRISSSFGDDYEMAGELYRLRKTVAGWKVSLNRGWPLKEKYGEKATTFDADTWKKLDSDADELVRTDERGDRAAQALMAAHRFREANDLLKKITAQKDATSDDWLHRGWVALTTGHADDALSAFRNALKLDENAPVPEFAREIQKE